MNKLLILILIGTYGLSFAQDTTTDPSYPSSLSDLLDEPGATTTLFDMLQKNALREAQNQQKKQQKAADQPKAGKPKSPKEDYKSDISEDAEAKRAREILEEKGFKVPERERKPDFFSGVPPERRLQLAESRLEHHEPGEALEEINHVLQTENLDSKLLLKAIPMRIKALMQSGNYEDCQDTFLRYQAYFPDEPGVRESEAYLMKESGLDVYQDKVLKNPNDIDAQRMMLQVYNHYQWDDLALRFFERAAKQAPSASVLSTLGTLYYQRKDFRKLVDISSQAAQLDPGQPRHLYNQAVGLYHLKDPLSLQQAKTLLKEARKLSQSETEIKNIDWYLARMP